MPGAPNARLGKGEWMIVEADESDGTFVKLPTQIGVVTNIDPEHLDYFKTVENMHREFEAFFRNIPFYGLAVTCIDHPVVRDMIERLELRRDGRRLLTYGASADADLRAARACAGARRHRSFDAELGARVKGGARKISGWTMPLPGHHNALNALAAIAVGDRSRHRGRRDPRGAGQLHRREAALPADRRRGTAWRSTTTTRTIRPRSPPCSRRRAPGAQGRVIAVVEPHRYTRVRDLFDEFCACFKDADT